MSGKLENLTVKPELEAEQKDIGLLFLANFVHQVVNPINGVIGTLDNITDGTYNHNDYIQKTNACRAQLEQCVTLIRNVAYLSDFFFEVSEKESLRKVREYGISVLPQVVIEAAQFFQIAAEKKGIHIELLDSKTQYNILIRPELLKQVFINIFDNCVKYGTANEKVRIDVRPNDKEELVIRIAGVSIGFNNNDAEKLFTLGFRSSEAKDRIAQGSGLGLYICKQIITKAIGGKISAEFNTRSSESTFRLAIPREKWRL